MISRQAIQSLADEIASRFDVERIILFGSYAYGTPTDDSDVDLLVLMEFEGRPREQRRAICRPLTNRLRLEMIVRTPSDAARRYNEFDPFIRNAFDRGQILYERAGTRVAIQS